MLRKLGTAWPVLAALLLNTAVSAAPAKIGGPGGPQKPPHPDPASALRYLIQGAVPGQPDGQVALVLRLYSINGAPNQIALAPTKLLEETQTVAVSGGQFTVALGGGTAEGIPPSLVAGHPRLYAAWALPASPTSEVGNVALYAVPYASTLSPGATIAGELSAPALTVSNYGTAVHATSHSTTARAIQGLATATSGVNYGVEGQSASSPGAGGNFINTGGGDLIHARNATGGPVLFRVTNNGDVYVRDVKIGQGPTGATGATGANGTNGLQGPPGPTGPSSPTATDTMCSIQAGNNCAPGQNGARLLLSVSFPCNVSSSAGFCTAAANQACCVYSQSKN